MPSKFYLGQIVYYKVFQLLVVFIKLEIMERPWKDLGAVQGLTCTVDGTLLVRVDIWLRPVGTSGQQVSHFRF